jgi:hypothetical protein
VTFMKLRISFLKSLNLNHYDIQSNVTILVDKTFRKLFPTMFPGTAEMECFYTVRRPYLLKVSDNISLLPW